MAASGFGWAVQSLGRSGHLECHRIQQQTMRCGDGSYGVELGDLSGTAISFLLTGPLWLRLIKHERYRICKAFFLYSNR